MSAPCSIAIRLKPIPENERYRVHLRDLTEPIYLIKDSVVGDCQITPPRGEILKHRGISVRLIYRYLSSNTIVLEHLVHEQKLFPSATLTEPFTFSFTFHQPSIPFPSYRGIKYHLSYFVVVDLRVSVFSKISENEQIVFLEPIIPAPSTAETVISVSFPPISFTFRTDKTAYATDDIINGQLLFGRSAQTDLQSVWVCLVVIESFRDGSSPAKTDETNLLSYELVDGAPRPNAMVPFVIQLAPLQLWAAKTVNNANVATRFKLNLQFMCNGVSKLAGTQPIQIYRRMLQGN
jgi:hypothetical protein